MQCSEPASCSQGCTAMEVPTGRHPASYSELGSQLTASPVSWADLVHPAKKGTVLPPCCSCRCPSPPSPGPMCASTLTRQSFTSCWTPPPGQARHVHACSPTPCKACRDEEQRQGRVRVHEWAGRVRPEGCGPPCQHAHMLASPRAPATMKTRAIPSKLLRLPTVLDSTRVCRVAA